MLASIQFSHWPLAMGIYSDMLQSGEKWVPMTPVLIAAVWWLLQVHLNVLSQTCVMLPALGICCSVYWVGGYMLLHLTVLLPNLCETVTTLPNMCQISLRNLQEIHLASTDIQHSHIISTFNKLERHEFLTAHLSIADLFRLEKESFKER